MANILERDDFDQNFAKTLGGYLGHLKPIIFWKNGIFGWPWMGTIQFWGQTKNLKNWGHIESFLSHSTEVNCHDKVVVGSLSIM